MSGLDGRGRMMLGRRSVLALPAGLALAAGEVRAQPAPLRIIVGFPAGTTPDTLARLYGNAIAGPLGQAVVVDNRVGAGGILAAEIAARAAPDGNTLFVGNNGPISITKHLTDKLPFDPDKDFRPVGFLGVSMQVLVARPGLAKDLAGFIAHAKMQEVNYGSVGAASASHLFMAGLTVQAGLKAQHVPYRGAPQALLEIAAGRVDVMVAAIGSALPLIREGKVVPLAVTGPQRDPLLPEVPSFDEAGVPGFVLPVWNALFAPRETPDAAVERIAKALADAQRDETVRRGVIASGFTLEDRDPAAMARFIEQESARWGEIARATGVRLTD
ncbi:Bug family tripartite tricarboxylate transporter substrate binding protein [Roseomonas xinghualingensis]|uniref:Bug family tripartite tricarboxylate transporter substrate binding protein n=1 Tax=Roseomonas xinghualingensis TaxID=2986475 RepID=UPI0021F11A7C|nr:tripartite tricarboxylate transporter substrate binding protein [Roseomonas sp. SXEYE001]MCV4206395.1 tripartite tricarboxylate transporter substrate binding protein [Roseomonas sp. SXEYE001]